MDIEFKNKFNKAHLMPGVGEKGRDVKLTFKGINRGLVQCKKYKKRLTKPEIAKEIIKFILYSIKDEALIPDILNFTYYIATSTGYSSKAIDLLQDFNNEIVKEEDLKKWTERVIKNTKSIISFEYDEIKPEFLEKISKLEVKYINPEDLERLLNKYQGIVPIFFKIKILEKK